MTSDVKVPFTKGELDGYTDALARVKQSIEVYERMMFIGGPKPSEVLATVMAELTARGQDAAQKGAITAPAREGQGKT